MGQILNRVQDLEALTLGWTLQQQARYNHSSNSEEDKKSGVVPRSTQFRDLSHLPPELALLVLSNLNATDLCLASCVWKNLGNDELLWHGLCRSQWRQVSAYRRREDPGFSYKNLYMQLDEATLTFNADPDLGMEYLINNGLVDDDPVEIALYIHTARHLDWQSRRDFLAKRPDVLDNIVQLQSFENQFLPNALRKFFKETTPPNERNDFLSYLVEKFSSRFCDCNPNLGLSKDTVYVICFSLIMLSVDLTSPHIRNKMSKREFIRNTRQATHGINDDFAGHLYDNVYLIGHVAPRA